MARGKRDGLLIAGGGLAGGLAALAMAKTRPDVPILLVEESNRFGGGNELWSFFENDIDEQDRTLIQPLIEHVWPGYYIAFPGRSRKLKAEFRGIRSKTLHQALVGTLRKDQYRFGTKVVAVRDNELVLTGGEKIRADGAIDARPGASMSLLEVGWQKFVGRDYRFAKPHRVDRPVMMDATVEQAQGYRFAHLLPFDEERMLVADVTYAMTPDMNPEAVGKRLDAYLTQRGWKSKKVEREEAGALPVALGGDFGAFWRVGGARVAKIGLRGGFFHPTTGYTLPDAVRTASLLAQQRDFTGAILHNVFEEYATQLWKKREFYRSFNATLLRKDAQPRDRFDHLFRLDPATIERFYAARPTMIDRMRIMSGKGAKG